MPVVRQQAHRAGSAPASTSPLNAEATDTLRRLTALLDGMKQISNATLQGLRDLCGQLHNSQCFIDAATTCAMEVAPLPGFRYAVLGFTQRLHAALHGKQPALVLQQPADVETICLGLIALASTKGASPYPARPDLMDQAGRALDGITGQLLAFANRHGVESMGYGQMLTIHNWISRGCKARLLKADSDCMQQARVFSKSVFNEFLRMASVWDTDGRRSMRLNEHDLGKTAAELKTMLDYELTPFSGKEASLALVVAWLSSEQAFTVLVAAEHGVGLSSLFSLFKRILDIGAPAAGVTAGSCAAQAPSPAGSDLLAALCKQMINSIGFLSPERLLLNDGRFLAACANLLRAMHESGLPLGWSAEQRLYFASTGRRLLDMVANADPACLSGLSLQTLANLVSFTKAWHKHEKQSAELARKKVAETTGKPHEHDVLPMEILAGIKRAARQIVAALPQTRLADLDASETVGGLLKGLSYLRRARLVASASTDPLLTALASAVAAIVAWPREHAVEVATCLNVLHSWGVYEWDALQPAFFALMGRPADDESWARADVEAFQRGEVTRRQVLVVPLDQYLKPVSSTQTRPERTHVVGDRPLKTPPTLVASNDAALPLSSTVTRSRPDKPRYVKSDAEGFIDASRVTKAKQIRPEMLERSAALLLMDREIDQEEEDEQASMSLASVEINDRQRKSAKPSSNQPARGKHKNGSKRNGPPTASGTPTAPARKRGGDIPPPQSELSSLPRGRLPQTTTPKQRRAIAKKISTAIQKNDEANALALLAGPGAEQIVGLLDDANSSLVHQAASAQMPALLNALLAYPEGRKRAVHPDKYGVTPLYVAAANGQLAMLESLLALDEGERNVFQKTITGDDAVCTAVDNNHPMVLKRLMQIDAVDRQLPDWRNGERKTMLEAAVTYRSADALRVLLTHPALVQQAASPATFGVPGMTQRGGVASLAGRAANLGDLPTLAALTEIPAVRRFEAASNNAFNIVGMALHCGDMALFDHLLQFPEFHRLAGLCTLSGCTPLMLAVRAGDDMLLARLLQLPEVRATIRTGPGKEYPVPLRWPANLRPETFRYEDVLHLAIKKRESAMVSKLLSLQEVVHAINASGDYAQRVLVRLVVEGAPSALETLLRQPIAARVACIADSNGRTALHHAAHGGRHEIVQVLLRTLPASEITLRNKEGKNAIDLARESGHGELADFLTSFAKVRRVLGMQ